jgi:hypothetical protein
MMHRARSRAHLSPALWGVELPLAGMVIEASGLYGSRRFGITSISIRGPLPFTTLIQGWDRME